MSHSQHVSIFDIPIILHSIGSYLTNHHLSQCIRVNKTWREYFLPVLYSSLYLCKERQSYHWHRNIIELDVLQRLNMSHYACTSKIETEVLCDRLWEDDTFLPRLRTLKLSWFNLGADLVKRTLPKVAIFLNRHPEIRHLDISLGRVVSDEAFTAIMTAIKSHPSLEHLKVVHVLQGKRRQICQILDCLQQLKSFEMRLWGSDQHSTPELVGHCRQTLERLGTTFKLRHLSLNIQSEIMDNAILSSLIPMCSKLESLDLDSYGVANQSNPNALCMETLASLIRNYCPNVKKLSIGVREDDSLELLKVCTGLKSLYLIIHGRVTTPLMSALAPRHTQTLTTLILLRPQGPDPETLLDILHSCPNLITLSAYICLESRPEDATEPHEQSLVHRMQRQWTSLNLQDLMLEFEFGSGHTTEYLPEELEVDPSFENMTMVVGDGSLMDRYYEHLLTMIGRLMRLRHLDVITPHNLLVLGQGHLSKLAGLRNLESVDLRHARDVDAQWVIEHWPYLEKVRGTNAEERGGDLRALLVQWKRDIVFS